MDPAWPAQGESKVGYWPKAPIAAGYRHSVGLRRDGTVIATGENRYGQCDVGGWREIVAVAAAMRTRETRTPSASKLTGRCWPWAGTNTDSA